MTTTLVYGVQKVDLEMKYLIIASIFIAYTFAVNHNSNGYSIGVSEYVLIVLQRSLQ